MNKEPCKNCGSANYYYWRKIVSEAYEAEECSECSSGRTPALSPDVYFDSSKGAFQTDPNLCDRHTGPIPFSSKREKAAILKRLNLREAGDKQHGGRNFDKKASGQWQGHKTI